MELGFYGPTREVSEPRPQQCIGNCRFYYKTQSMFLSLKEENYECYLIN